MKLQSTNLFNLNYMCVIMQSVCCIWDKRVVLNITIIYLLYLIKYLEYRMVYLAKTSSDKCIIHILDENNKVLGIMF